MTMARDLVPVPRPAAHEALDAFFAEGHDRPGNLQLRVRIRTERLPLRQLADYLWMVDRLYGRTDPKGLRSYSLRHRARLEVAETRSGSLDLILQQAVGLANPDNLLLLWILVRGLPGAGHIISNIVRNYAQAYHAYEAGRLARAQRGELRQPAAEERRQRRRLSAHIRELLLDDPRLAELPSERVAQIARFD